MITRELSSNLTMHCKKFLFLQNINFIQRLFCVIEKFCYYIFAPSKEDFAEGTFQVYLMETKKIFLSWESTWYEDRPLKKVEGKYDFLKRWEKIIEEKCLARDSIQFLRWNNESSFVTIRLLFASTIWGLWSSCYLLLVLQSPRPSLRKRQYDTFSGHTKNQFFRIRTFFTKKKLLLLMILIFIYCLLQSNKLTLNGPDNDFSI